MRSGSTDGEDVIDATRDTPHEQRCWGRIRVSTVQDVSWNGAGSNSITIGVVQLPPPQAAKR